MARCVSVPIFYDTVQKVKTKNKLVKNQLDKILVYSCADAKCVIKKSFKKYLKIINFGIFQNHSQVDKLHRK